jgi:hypothetical protein
MPFILDLGFPMQKDILVKPIALQKDYEAIILPEMRLDKNFWRKR